jgi:hypothetical protein
MQLVIRHRTTQRLMQRPQSLKTMLPRRRIDKPLDILRVKIPRHRLQMFVRVELLIYLP